MTKKEFWILYRWGSGLRLCSKHKTLKQARSRAKKCAPVSKDRIGVASVTWYK